MKKSERTTVQVVMNKELVKKLDEVADRYGMTRSAYCAFVLGQNLDAVNLFTEKVKNIEVDKR